MILFIVFSFHCLTARGQGWSFSIARSRQTSAKSNQGWRSGALRSGKPKISLAPERLAGNPASRKFILRASGNRLPIVPDIGPTRAAGGF